MLWCENGEKWGHSVELDIILLLTGWDFWRATAGENSQSLNGSGRSSDAQIVMGFLGKTVPPQCGEDPAAALILNLFDKMKVQERRYVFSKCHNFLRSLHLPSRGATSALPCSEEEKTANEKFIINSDLGGLNSFKNQLINLWFYCPTVLQSLSWSLGGNSQQLAKKQGRKLLACEGMDLWGVISFLAQLFDYLLLLWAEVQRAWQIHRVTIHVKQNLLEKVVDCFIASILSHDKGGMVPDSQVGAWWFNSHLSRFNF